MRKNTAVGARNKDDITFTDNFLSVASDRRWFYVKDQAAGNYQ